MEGQFALEYLIDMDYEDAARRCGIVNNPRWFGRAMLQRPNVKKIIAAEMEARCVRVRVDSDLVLRELVSQWARLRSMLDRDIAEIYDDRGNLRPVSEWPRGWRTRLISEITTQQLSERSHDGETRDREGGWDQVGQVTKIKRTDALAIERELRACLGEIGRHTDVSAFPVPGAKLGEGMEALAATIDKALSDGRRRAARVILPPNEPTDPDKQRR